MSPLFKKKKKPERRNSPRILSFNLVRSAKENEGRENRVSNLTDLSETGLQCRFRGNIRKADRVKMTINLMREGANIEVIAEVMWAKPLKASGTGDAFKIGVRFTDISNKDRRSLMEFLGRA